MDKYEYKIRSEEIKSLIARGEYVEAATIADTIDWRRVKSVMMLCTISDLYKINRRFEDARDMLLLAYDRHPGGRSIVYSLCELSIKMGEFVQAVEYYKEFVQVAPRDSGRYVLQYKLYEAQDVSIEERIEVLEELKSKDYSEKWAYELAYLYHRIGLATKCVEECDELIVWFGEGKYVLKAMELKMLHEPLNYDQQVKYNEAKGISMPVAEETEQYSETEQFMQDLADAPTKEIPQKELDIQVKLMNVGQYDTINMQKELAQNMKELWEGSPAEDITPGKQNVPLTEEPFAEGQNTDNERDEEEESREMDPVMQAIMAPLLNSDTGIIDLPDEESEEEPVEPEETKVEEVFFGETGEIDTTASQILQEMKQESLASEKKGTEEKEEESVPAMAQKGMIERRVDEKPTGFEKILGMEYDGQISMIMPDSEQVEKQITGQIRLEDVLVEWEKMKKDSEQKRMEAVRQRVMQQTGAMFTEFEAATRDGLLEQLEKGSESLQDGDSDSFEEIEEIEENGDESYGGDEEIAEDFGESDETEEGFEELDETDEGFEESDETEEGFEESDETEESFEESDETEEGFEESGETEEGFEESDETEEGFEESDETEEGFEESDETEEGFEESDETEEGFEESDETEEAIEEPDEMEESFEDSDEMEESDEKSEESGEVEEKEESHKAVNNAAAKKTKVRSLSPEERQLFGAYIQSRNTKEQIVHAIDNISLAAYTGNVIITGEEGMDTMTLARNLIKEVQQTDSNFSGKIAKISGDSLNRKGVEQPFSKLANGALIIQKAAGLKKSTIEKMQKALEQEHSGLIVILEDLRKPMNKFLNENPSLTRFFNIRIDIEALDNDTLVAFGKKYAKDQEYSIDELGVLALHTRIAERQTSDHAVTMSEVKEILDEAIRHANKKTMGHFFDILVAKRYDEEDMIILREKDFI